MKLQKKVLAGVPVIIQNSKKEILLGKRSKNTLYPLVWGLPGGLIEYGETFKQAAKREIKEEMGVTIEIIKVGKTCDSLPTKECPSQAINIPIYAKITKGKPLPKSETLEVKWFTKKQIRKMKLAYSHKQILKQEGLI